MTALGQTPWGPSKLVSTVLVQAVWPAAGGVSLNAVPLPQAPPKFAVP